MATNEIHADMVQTLTEDSPFYATVKNGLWNSCGAGRAQMTLSQVAQKPQPLIKKS